MSSTLLPPGGVSDPTARIASPGDAATKTLSPLELARLQGAANGKQSQDADDGRLPPEYFHSLFSPSKLTWKRTDKIVLTWMIVMHLGAIAAPFFFTWSGLGVAVLLHWATCSIGICLCYHRYLSHRSFKLKKPAELVCLFIGAISGEGGPLTWLANHRLHHSRSDQVGDPHSPTDGPWWSHLLWFLPKLTAEEQKNLFDRYAPEHGESKAVHFFERTYFSWLVVSGLLLIGLGYALGGVYGAISMVLWGLCMRAVVSYHSTWFVNSATHIWGYRNYDTRDLSRNLWWVAILSYGEGWHNNHHAHPSIAPAGHRWWELDPTWWAICFLRLIGQATDVKDQLPEGRAAAEDQEPVSSAYQAG